jgi:RNA polymerase sigma-70 factor (ECF subfamily)
MMLPAAEEQALVARAKAGDRRAFEALVREHAERLYAVILRFCATETDACEVTQRTFVRASDGLSGCSTEQRFFAYLYRLGVDEAHRTARRAADREAADGAVHVRTTGELGGHRGIERDDLGRTLERGMRRLPEIDRAAVVLHDVEGLATAQAAAALGLGEARFKRCLRRGRMALRRAVGDGLPDRGARTATGRRA